MLIVLTLLVISGIRASNTNLRIAGNMQMQEEAAAAAQQGIEQVLSTDFTTALAAASIPIDINGTTYNAQVDAPVCTSSLPLTGSAFCQSSDTLGGPAIMDASGVPMTSTLLSCLTQTWDIRSTVTDGNTGAGTTVRQGVYIIRDPTQTACP